MASRGRRGATGGRTPLATTDGIRTLAREIAVRFRPQRVLLFGSYARGSPGPDSDVDLLVIMPTSLRPLEQAALISQAVEHRFPLDILVRTPEQLEEGLRSSDLFLQEVMSTAVTLYEASDPSVD